jgi:hypothetical protein
MAAPPNPHLQEFNMCVADMYFCDYYCKYTPSWYYGLVAKGEKACPVDSSLIDPLNPDPIFPGFATNGPVAGRRLLAERPAAGAPAAVAGGGNAAEGGSQQLSRRPARF